MINRIILALLFILSIGWIGYVGLDILNRKQNFSANSIFGEGDKALLIVNRADELRLSELSDFMDSPCSSLYESLDKTEFTKVFISQKRAHILIERTNNWNKQRIESLLKNASKSPQIKGSEISFNNFKGRYFKQKLYIYSGEVQESHADLRISYDKKASGSIVQFANENKIESVTDIYFNLENKVDFITHNAEIKQGKQINDEILFGRVISSKIDAYQFFERDFLITKDSVFAKGPMSSWLLNGFVEVNYNGEKAIISDYILGQDPILILNDLNQSVNQVSFNQELTQDFPTKGKSYFIKYLDDMVVISESENTCDNLIGEHKLGNTLALNTSKRNFIYGQLPKSVSERKVSADIKMTRSVYRGKIHQTQLNATSLEPSTTKNETTSMNCGFDIHDFTVLESTNTIVAVGKQGEVACFENGSLKWKKQLKNRGAAYLSTIDLNESGKDYILLHYPDKVYLWNVKGEHVNGFPISLEDDSTNEVKFYRWKGKGYFILASKNKVLHFDAQGRELTKIEVDFEVTRKIDVWVSINNLYAGFSNGQQFQMYKVDNTQVHRQFETPPGSIAVKIPNELVQFSFIENDLYSINQKGVKTKLGNYPNGKVFSYIQNGKNPTLIVKSNNKLHFLNKDGIGFGEIQVPFNEIENVFIGKSTSGKNVVSIIDGIENNVYLYRTTGEKFNNRVLEGQTKAVISSKNKSQLVTTIIDQFIVQYYIN